MVSLLVWAFFLVMSSHGLPWHVNTERKQKKKREKERFLVASSYYKGINPIMRA